MREGLDDQGTYFQIHEVENTTPIVFIHGVGLNHEIWNPQIEFFKKQTTITYDLFCHGKSTCAFDQISFEDFSSQINGLLQFLSCLLYTSPSPRDGLLSRMPSSA